MPKKTTVPVFKDYLQGQTLLLPRDLDEEIEPNHLVRVVNAAVERMDLSRLYAQYRGGGTSSYHPKMLLKVLLYAYTQQIYSSRKIAKALRENIHFMWLSGNSHPDFHTINRFRGEVVKETIQEIFAALLVLLAEGGYIQLEHYFVDGTKLEANANKYSFVWAKSTRHYKQRVQEKVGRLLEHIQQLTAAEDAQYGEQDLPERGLSQQLDAAQLEAKIQELNERLRQLPPEDPPASPPPAPPGDGVNGRPAAPSPAPIVPAQANKRKRHPSKAHQLAKAIQQLAMDYLPRLQKYEAQEKLLSGRNSYAKTDPEATFMRMKDDPMQNGQLKAGYNLQTGTENQFVVGFSVHQRPGDPGCLIPHLEETRAQRGGRQPKVVIADSAYGSEENYLYLEQEHLQAYVKYNTFYQETRPRHKPNPFAVQHLAYDPQRDIFTCPGGQELHYQSTHHDRTENGFESQYRAYAAQDCSACPLKPQCTKAVGNRQIKVNFRLWQLRAQAKQKLLSEEGRALRARRSVEVETVFGRLKQNWGYRRFLLRGIQKVKTEWGLLCMAHNLAKLAVA